MTAAARIRGLAVSVAIVLGFGTVVQAHPRAAHGKRSLEPRSLGSRSLNSSAALRHGAALAFYTGPRIGHVGGRSALWQHYGRHTRFASRMGHSGGIQCVAFARADSGIELSGNASAWWDHAAGVYQRGDRPEPGSVLNFRANGAMRMGHVAVVNEVIDSRTVDIDHANWGGPGASRGQVSRDIRVVDVSPNNDWSAVRVGLGHTDEYGSIYPTYGFIYNRPDPGTMVAASGPVTPIPALNPAPRDLRGNGPDSEGYDEVAEAPDSSEPHYYHRAAYHHRHHVAPHHHHAPL